MDQTSLLIGLHFYGKVILVLDASFTTFANIFWNSVLDETNKHKCMMWVKQRNK